MNPDTLRTYANIFALPRRCVDGILRDPTEAELAAAHALRFLAAAIDAGLVSVDPHHAPQPCTAAQSHPCTEGRTTRTSSRNSAG